MYMCESSYIFTGCGEESAKWRCTQTPKEEEELEESSSSCTTTTVKGELYPPPLFFPLLNIWQGNYHQREPIYLVYTGRQGCSYISLFLSFSPLIAISLGPYSPPLPILAVVLQSRRHATDGGPSQLTHVNLSTSSAHRYHTKRNVYYMIRIIDSFSSRHTALLHSLLLFSYCVVSTVSLIALSESNNNHRELPGPILYNLI
jgi:hypothetical protein